jgi:general secretion pathway protein L
MPPNLLIRLSPDGAAEWLALGRDGRMLAGPQAGLPAAGAEHIDVLVPAEDVLLLRAPRVARQRRQLEQALPFAIEEQLAASIETLHVAAADGNDGAELTVAVVAQSRLDGWLQKLRAAGLEPDRLLPETWLLPHAPGAATVLIDGARALVRHSEAGAFAGHVDELPTWLHLLDADTGRPTPLRWLGAADRTPSSRTIEREDVGTPLRWFAHRLAHAGGLNLLQGRYAPRRGREGAQRLWRWAAGFAIAAVVLAFAQLLIERQQLAARQVAQRAEMEALLRTAMPNITRIVDPKAQLMAEYTRLGSGGAQAGALPLLARIAPLIAGSGRYTLDAIEFRADSLELTLRTTDIAALDGLREALAGLPSLEVEVTSANPGSGGIEGRLRIRSRA